jgi:hypothetical protein
MFAWLTRVLYEFRGLAFGYMLCCRSAICFLQCMHTSRSNRAIQVPAYQPNPQLGGSEMHKILKRMC